MQMARRLLSHGLIGYAYSHSDLLHLFSYRLKSAYRIVVHHPLRDDLIPTVRHSQASKGVHPIPTIVLMHIGQLHLLVIRMSFHACRIIADGADSELGALDLGRCDDARICTDIVIWGLHFGMAVR
jgi:hypothetical protein